MPARSSPTPPAVRRAIREIGRHLADWRRLHGLSASQVADRAGTSIGTVYRIESGDGASLENILRVARALGVIEQVVAAVDPTTTDIGRARALESLPRRVSGRRGMSP